MSTCAVDHYDNTNIDFCLYFTFNKIGTHYGKCPSDNINKDIQEKELCSGKQK